MEVTSGRVSTLLPFTVLAIFHLAMKGCTSDPDSKLAFALSYLIGTQRFGTAQAHRTLVILRSDLFRLDCKHNCTFPMIRQEDGWLPTDRYCNCKWTMSCDQATNNASGWMLNLHVGWRVHSQMNVNRRHQHRVFPKNDRSNIHQTCLWLQLHCCHCRYLSHFHTEAPSRISRLPLTSSHNARFKSPSYFQSWDFFSSLTAALGIIL